ncbi:RNA-directed DNA polymerase [Cobetia sp. UCD-24C]|uniref:RNA-directed DNA polymerase n=1 Tax=Cobetia sp. UCD-24C TaxID=1716176 RepID=UPI0009EA40EC|nr:RNA-directed DNA polymerase [Cobetia sp. UCD-24C]
MFEISPMEEHKNKTKQLAQELSPNTLLDWLLTTGYFPEEYVLPPCFKVKKKPQKVKPYKNPKADGTHYNLDTVERIDIKFPINEYSDRTFSIINPKIHHDIAQEIATNWDTLLDRLIPENSDIYSYSFPLPLVSEPFGTNISESRSGSMIFKFLEMTENDLTSAAYNFKSIVKLDIKNFYGSIYTHSIAWAIHDKEFSKNHKNDFNFLGNRLDKLFQHASDGQTNGIPVGPVVSDIISELIASSIDIGISKKLKEYDITYKAARFKDDYRFLVKNEADGKVIISTVYEALRSYQLELNGAKTEFLSLPSGLFRQWVSKYHLATKIADENYTWLEFRETYLSIISIDKEYPNTGVVDKFLSDIVNPDGKLKLELNDRNTKKTISMLLMLGNLRARAFPKIIAIIESIYREQTQGVPTTEITQYLYSYLEELTREHNKNNYLISWLAYFLVSNKLMKKQVKKLHTNDLITKCIIQNKNHLFEKYSDFILFENSISSGEKTSLLEHLKLFKNKDKEEDNEGDFFWY